MKSGSGRGRKSSSGGRSENNFTGIHHRRDKRYPLQSSRPVADVDAEHHFPPINRTRQTSARTISTPSGMKP